MAGQFGLYSPEPCQEKVVFKNAEEQLSEILNLFEAQIKEWQNNYRSLGAKDTVVRETILGILWEKL